MSKQEHDKWMQKKMKEFLKKKKIKKYQTFPIENNIRFEEKGKRALGDGCYISATKHYSSSEQD